MTVTILGLCGAFGFGWALKGAFVRADAQFNARVAAAQRNSMGVPALVGSDVDGQRW